MKLKSQYNNTREENYRLASLMNNDARFNKIIRSPKDTDVVRNSTIYISMFIAVTTNIAKLWKEPRCPSTDEWIRKMWSIYTMEYYASIRKDEYPTFVATWTGLEEIMLSEISQAERVNYPMVSLICGATRSFCHKTWRH